MKYFRFLVATKRLYMRVCPSVRPSVGWMVRRSVTSYFFGLLGATNAMYTAFLLISWDGVGNSVIQTPTPSCTGYNQSCGLATAYCLLTGKPKYLFRVFLSLQSTLFVIHLIVCQKNVRFAESCNEKLQSGTTSPMLVAHCRTTRR